MKQKLYISGPMTGIPDLNRSAFNAEAAWYRALGHEVVNPAEVELGEGAAWLDYMRVDIKLMMDCDRIHMLPGWQASRGAMVEYNLALALGLAVSYAPAAQAAEAA